MWTITKTRRRQRRYEISGESRASVEFEHPVPHGAHHRLYLTNVSASGISFLVEHGSELGRLEEGASLPRAIVRFGECMIHGDLIVMHFTPGPTGYDVCGALLYPASDMDLVKLKGVIAGLEAAQPPG
jgi:hypothetical protein